MKTVGLGKLTRAKSVGPGWVGSNLSEYRKSLLCCVLFCLALGAVAAYDLRSAYLKDEEGARVRVANNSYLIGEWIKGAFKSSDYVLRDVVGQVSLSELVYPPTDMVRHGRRTAFLEAKGKTLPNTIMMGLFDEHCIATHSNVTPGFDASDREYCLNSRTDTHSDTHVSHAFKASTGFLNVTQTRRLHGDVPGKFYGFAALGLDLNFFAKWLEPLSIAPHGVIAIVDTRLSLLARKPAWPDGLGKKIHDPVVESFIGSGDQYKTFRGISPIDTESRLFGARKIDDLPFVIVVGEADRDWQEDWRQRVWGTTVALALLYGMAIVTLRGHWAVLRQKKELALERDRAERLSVTDALTGLANRRRFDAMLASEIERQRRTGAPLSLVILDVDHFKLYNDTYGHPAGDECLRAVAAVIDSRVGRAVDTAARYGGEEFACILPNTGRVSALALAERIRAGVADLNIPHRASAVAEHVTLSVGVASAAATDTPDEPARFIALADECLYRAKATGRNRVVG